GAAGAQPGGTRGRDGLHADGAGARALVVGLDRDRAGARVAAADLAEHADALVARADHPAAVEREPVDAARHPTARAEPDDAVVVLDVGLGDQAGVLAELHAGGVGGGPDGVEGRTVLRAPVVHDARLARRPVARATDVDLGAGARRLGRGRRRHRR